MLQPIKCKRCRFVGCSSREWWAPFPAANGSPGPTKRKLQVRVCTRCGGEHIRWLPRSAGELPFRG